MKVNLPTYYNQMDSVWAYLILGFNTDKKFNFYNYACLITAFAMVAVYYGKKESPVTINEKIKGLGEGVGFEKGTALYKHGSFNRIFPDITEVRTRTPDLLSDKQLQEIKDALAKKYPVIVQIDYNPTTVYPDQHFVVFTDFNPNDENDFTIIDPIGGKMRSLKEYLKQPIDRVRETILQYIILEGTVPQQTSTETIVVEKRDWEKALKAMGNIERVGDHFGYNREMINTVGFGDIVVDRIKQVQSSYNILKDSISKNPLKEDMGFVAINKDDQITPVSTQPQIVTQPPDAVISPQQQAVAFYDKDIMSIIVKFLQGIKWKN